MSGGLSRLPWLSRDRIDVSTAVAGLAVAVALLPLGFLTSEVLVRGIPVSLGLGCLFYLVCVDATDGRLRSTDRALNRTALAVPGLRVVRSLVVVGLAGLVLVAVFTGGRPLPFLLLAGAVGSLLMAQIVFADAAKLDHRTVLVAIVAYATILRFAGLFTTPGFVGIDTWTHVTSYAAAVQESHSLSAISGIKYSTIPFYHLITVAAAELLGLSLRNALYLTIGTLMPLSVLSIYAAARYVTGVRWALFATLAFAVSNYAMEWGLIVATTSLGLALFLVVFLFVARAVFGDAGRTDYVVMAAFAFCVTLSHQMSSFVTLSVLGTAAVATYCSRWFASQSRGLGERAASASKPLAAVFGAYLAFTLTMWSITPWRGESFLSRGAALLQVWVASRIGFLNIVDTTGRGVREPSSSAGVPAQLVSLFDNLGLLLLILVAVIGCLVLLQRERSAGSLTLIAILTVTAVVSFGFPLFGFNFLLPSRWLAFMMVPAVIVGALGVGYVTTRASSRVVVASVVVFLLVFPGAMVMSQEATKDRPTFDEEWPKYAYSQSEVDAVATINELRSSESGPVYTDHPYYTVFDRLHQDPAERREAPITDGAFMIPLNDRGEASASASPVVYRRYQSTGRPAFEGADEASVTRHLSREQACADGRNHVYGTDRVLMCVSPGT